MSKTIDDFETHEDFFRYNDAQKEHRELVKQETGRIFAALIGIDSERLNGSRYKEFLVGLREDAIEQAHALATEVLTSLNVKEKV